MFTPHCEGKNAKYAGRCCALSFMSRCDVRYAHLSVEDRSAWNGLSLCPHTEDLKSPSVRIRLEYRLFKQPVSYLSDPSSSGQVHFFHMNQLWPKSQQLLRQLAVIIFQCLLQSSSRSSPKSLLWVTESPLLQRSECRPRAINKLNYDDNETAAWYW